MASYFGKAPGDQQFAIIQAINRTEMRRDLILAGVPHLAPYYEVSVTDLSEMALHLARAQDEIAKLQDTLRLDACRKCLMEVSPDYRSLIRELSAGIWDL